MDTYFARQPIFDRQGALAGYELLYRASPEAVAATGDTAIMAARVVSDSLLGMDITSITDGARAFLNAPRPLLVDGLLAELDPGRLVIEVLETVEPDAEVVTACRRLVEVGHVLALDDWSPDDPRSVLLDLVSIVKVDVLDRPIEQVLASVAPLAVRQDIALLAERVETADVHQAYAESGFSLFQGYFYRKPELVRRRDLRPEQLQLIEAMNLVQDENVSDVRLAEHFRHDPSLAYKVVRMANVALLGGRRIESVQHAIALVGRDSLFRWLALMLAASYGRSIGVSRELLREALVRARMCELLGTSGGARSSGHLFLVGLFSRIDALLGVPLDSVLERVALPDPARAALLRRDGPYAPLLTLVEAWESGHWEALSGETRDLPGTYGAAIGWADAVHRGI